MKKLIDVNAVEIREDHRWIKPIDETIPVNGAILHEEYNSLEEKDIEQSERKRQLRREEYFIYIIERTKNVAASKVNVIIYPVDNVTEETKEDDLWRKCAGISRNRYSVIVDAASSRGIFAEKPENQSS